MLATIARTSPGLSPRVRGSLWLAYGADPFAGSIPARAGEPITQSFGAVSIGVYPRACGGADTAAAGLYEAEGLSPRVRGSHTDTAKLARRHGSIPARAGEPGA